MATGSFATFALSPLFEKPTTTVVVDMEPRTEVVFGSVLP